MVRILYIRPTHIRVVSCVRLPISMGVRLAQASIAQLVERLTRNEKVNSSILFGGPNETP